MSIQMGTDEIVFFEFTAADLIANTPKEIVSPVTGWIRRLRTIVQATITTGGTITVKNGNASVANPQAVTAVAGISVTVANSAAVGTTANSLSTPEDVTAKVTAGDRIQIFPASFATAGRVSGTLSFNSATNK